MKKKDRESIPFFFFLSLHLHLYTLFTKSIFLSPKPISTLHPADYEYSRPYFAFKKQRRTETGEKRTVKRLVKSCTRGGWRDGRRYGFYGWTWLGRKRASFQHTSVFSFVNAAGADGKLPGQ